MDHKTLQIASRSLIAAFLIILCTAISLPVYASPAELIEEIISPSVLAHPEGWELQKGDWIYVDISANTLQFVREDDSDRSQLIQVGSGMILQPGRKFYYIGRAYDPRTPEKTWEIRSSKQQRWYNVFGTKEAREQLFLRLHEVRGEQRIATPYGIHTSPEIELLLEKDRGYGSWGCILTRYDLLKMIEELYHLNEQVVKVVTEGRGPEYSELHGS